MSDNPNHSPDHNRGSGNKSIFLALILVGIMIFIFIQMITGNKNQVRHKEIGYDEFITQLEKNNIEEVEVTDERIVMKFKGNKSTLYFTGIMPDYDLISKLRDANVKFKRIIPNTTASLARNLFLSFLPLLILILLMVFVFREVSKRSRGIMGVGKSNARVYMEKKTGKTFKDVAGQEEAKESVTEIVDFLHNPGKYTKIGAKLPKGALLVGPPGTGKTLLAKAVAGEANVPFFSLSGSDFVEMYVGVGASRVRDLFKQAQEAAPCIIFIDEIDAIGKSRDSRLGGNDEREQTLNQLLAEMDGFDSSKGVVILAATNRPEILDKALLRPGRFDRRIIVDKPDLKGRVQVLKVHAKNVLMDDSVDFDEIALATSGAVGSDLANMINEAAINAVKNGRDFVTQADLFESVELVIAGKEKKDRIMSAAEKRIVAFHEVGHALVTTLNKKLSEPVQKITIIPRTMGSLGYVMHVPEEEKYLMSKDELLARIATLLGGRAAERIVFQTETTGASNDIEKATELARAMITQYGMSDKFGLVCIEKTEDKYLQERVVMNCSQQTEAEVDEEIRRILGECYQKALSGLGENRKALDTLAEYLIEHETITGKEFMKIFHEVNDKKDFIE